MTLREQLLAVRAIVAESSPEPNHCGCLEDAICRVVYGKAWSPFFAHELGIEAMSDADNYKLRDLPVYQALVNEGRILGHLFIWNDQHTKDERLALIDRTLASEDERRRERLHSAVDQL